MLLKKLPRVLRSATHARGGGGVVERSVAECSGV